MKTTFLFLSIASVTVAAPIPVESTTPISTIILNSSLQTHSFILDACLNLASKYTYECPSEYSNHLTSSQLSDRNNKPTACDCYSPEYLGTVMDCIESQNSLASLNYIQKRSYQRQTFNPAVVALNNFVATCRPNNPTLSSVSLQALYANTTKFLIKDSDFIRQQGNTPNRKSFIHVPISFSKDQISNEISAVQPKIALSGTFFGSILLAYFAFVVLVAAIFNALSRGAPRFCEKASQTRPIAFFRKHIVHPAMFSYHHALPVKKVWSVINMALPTRAQCLIIFGYFALLTAFNFVCYDARNRAYLFPNPTQQTLARMVTSRTGSMAITQLPIIALFGCRNNLLIQITGWSHSTFTVYQRWIARLTFALVFVHAVSLNYVNTTDLTVAEETMYWQWGIPATIFSGLYVLFSFRIFREKLHETSLVLRGVCAIVLTVFLWMNTAKVGQLKWVISSVALVAADWFCRFVRIIFSDVQSIGCASLSPSKNFVKMKITYSNNWHFFPGSHVYVYFKKPWYLSWQNHPFSCYPSPLPGEEDKLMVCFKAHDGITKRIADDLEAGPSDDVDFPIMMEHYGQQFPLDDYNSVVLVAGGIGITSVLAYANHLKSWGKSKRVSVHWVVREDADVQFFSEELKSLMVSGNMKITVYLTGKRFMYQLDNSSNAKTVLGSQTSLTNDNTHDLCKESLDEMDVVDLETQSNASDETDSTISDFSDEKMSPSNSNFVTIKRQITSIEQWIGCTIVYGRPDFGDLVQSSIKDSTGTTAFMACGPPAMNDTVRKIVSNQMDNCEHGKVGLYLDEFIC